MGFVDMHTFDHFIIMALMDQLRTDNVLTTPKITEILQVAEQNFVEYKERIEEKFQK